MPAVHAVVSSVLTIAGFALVVEVACLMGLLFIYFPKKF